MKKSQMPQTLSSLIRESMRDYLRSSPSKASQACGYAKNWNDWCDCVYWLRNANEGYLDHWLEDPREVFEPHAGGLSVNVEGYRFGIPWHVCLIVDRDSMPDPD